MRLAIKYIGQEKQAIETVALRLGYSSLAAFSQAFSVLSASRRGIA